MVSRSKSSRFRRGFTLPELLTVIAVMVVLMALVVPAANDVVTARRLKHAEELITSEIQFWRQSAMVKNAVVEICFIKQARPGNENATAAFRAVRSRLRNKDGSTVWLSKKSWLPDAIVMEPSGGLSNILDKVPLETHPPLDDAPLSDEAYSLVSLSVRPWGGLDPVGSLLLSEPWFVTLVKEADLGKPAGNLKDYITIQIDPSTGRVTTYRP